MTKGGVMIGRMESARSSGFIGMRVRSATSAKARPSSVVSRPTRAASATVFQATPQPCAPVRQPETPDRWAQQFRQELAGCKGAIVVAHRGGENAQHRVEHEQCDQADDKQQRASDEHVALAGTESGEAVGKEHEAGERIDRGAPAQGRLTGPVAEQSSEPGVSPAAVDDEQAFAGQPCESGGAGGDKESRRLACEPGPGGK